MVVKPHLPSKLWKFLGFAWCVQKATLFVANISLSKSTGTNCLHLFLIAVIKLQRQTVQ